MSTVSKISTNKFKYVQCLKNWRIARQQYSDLQGYGYETI